MAAAFQQLGAGSFPTFWVTAEPPHKRAVETAELLGPATDELATEFRKLKTHFYVAPRVVDGQLLHRDVIEHPRDLTSPLQGRWDVSSSQIRAVALELRREHQVVGW